MNICCPQKGKSSEIQVFLKQEVRSQVFIAV